MYIFLGDETDPEAGSGEWFIYGGVFVPVAEVGALHLALDSLRQEFNLAPTDQLKFGSRTRPQQLSQADHTQLKSRVIGLARPHGVKFCAQVVLHELARNVDQRELVRRGANTVLSKFNAFLRETNEFGLALLDRQPNPYDYIRQKFQVGLEFEGGRIERLERITGFASTCDGASHIASLADIILGGFRYCVNEPERDRIGRLLLPQIAQIMWYERVGTHYYLRERGLVTRPREIRREHYQQRYDGLLDRLQMLIADAPDPE